LNFSVKLDSNGTNPKILKELVNEQLIDYVAMDIKAPIEKYSDVVCTKVDTNKVKESIDFLLTDIVPYEFRTTVVKSQLTESDFLKIGEQIKGAKKYYLQRFLPTKTLDKNFLSEETYCDEDFQEIKNSLKPFVDFIGIR
jgi:pyruvate formate lyase activating enzyme